MAEGIDVSKWQQTIDWNKVAAAGKKFAVARASIAAFTQDATFVDNYKGMVAAGLVPGAYHLVSGQSTGEAQAANFKAQLDAVKFDKGLLVLDVEAWSETVNNLNATLSAVEYLCNWIRATYKRTPIIYTGVFWRDNLKQFADTFGARLWLSYYGTNPVENYVPTAWKNVGWTIWQYSNSGHVDGIASNINVDLNKTSGTLKDLKTLAGWEWSDMATADEIRAIVKEEVSNAQASLLVALSKTQVELSEGITLAIQDIQQGTSETVALHKHICQRADLHMEEG